MSEDTIGRILKRHELKPWRQKKMWCVAKIDDAYLDNMEDVLATYEKPLNPAEPVVCVDEDYEYKRKGMVNVFCAIEPKRGRHFIKITKDRKADQFAEMLRDIGRASPAARKIHLVMDNLSTHTKKSLVKTLGPKRGANLWARFEVHYTPKHGSWLNQAEIEISMFSPGCLGKDRIGTRVTLTKRAAAWERAMNKEKRKIDWRFTRAKARLKFNYSYAKSAAGRD